MAHGDGMVNAMDEEPIVQRNSTATLIHKMKEDALVTAPNRSLSMQPDAAADPQQKWADSWNNWLARAIEAERDFMHDVHAQVIAEERKLWRREIQDKLSSETRVLSEQIKALQAEVSGLRTALAEQRAVVGLYKELGDQAVRLHALGTQVAGFAKDVGPFVERLRRLGLEQ
jgi:hypothetical protein